jgi:hypothetical protein
LAATFVCQFTTTPVAVAFVVTIFVIVRGPGFPPPAPDALVKPEQPQLKSMVATVNRISKLVRN